MGNLMVFHHQQLGLGERKGGVYIYICIYVHMYTCIYVHMYICIYVPSKKKHMVSAY